jgi:hypothetical protein
MLALSSSTAATRHVDLGVGGSALLEFMAGKLGAPGCWPNERHFSRTEHEELRALKRWENEGGRTPSLHLPNEHGCS